MKIVTTTHKCDICGNTSKPEEGPKPKDWVSIEIEDTRCERSWHQKSICPYCLKAIDFELKKQDKKL